LIHYVNLPPYDDEKVGMEYAEGKRGLVNRSNPKAFGAGMVSYEFYLRDPIKGYQLVGVLPERRRNPKRITEESVLNWGEKYFGKHLDLDEMFYLEVELNGESVRTL
jgi:hypothetical protein